MNELFMFYWFHWLFIIIVYFFMERTNVRVFLIIWLLIIILCRTWNIETIFSLHVSVSYIILFVGAFLFFALHTYVVTDYVFTFTLMIGYMALLMWEKVTPVWFFISTPVFISFFVSLLTFYFIDTLQKQIALVIFSMTIGYTMFYLTLLSYHWKITEMEESLYVLLSFTICFLLFFHGMKRLFLYAKWR